MNIFKSMVLTACCAGLISLIAEFISPKENLKNNLKFIISIVTILCLFFPIILNKNDITICNFKPDENNFSCSEYSDIKKDVNEYYIDECKKNIENIIKNNLIDRKINFCSVNINCDTDEYNCINIKSIDIKVINNKDNDKIISLINELIPNANVNIKTEDKNESSRY